MYNVRLFNIQFISTSLSNFVKRYCKIFHVHVMMIIMSLCFFQGFSVHVPPAVLSNHSVLSVRWSHAIWSQDGRGERRDQQLLSPPVWRHTDAFQLLLSAWAWQAHYSSGRNLRSCSAASVTTQCVFIAQRMRIYTVAVDIKRYCLRHIFLDRWTIRVTWVMH